MTDVATPEVLWAQRSSGTDPEANFIYLTINVPDVPKGQFELDLQPSGLSFKGTSNTLKRTYQVKLDFYADIDPAASRVNHSERDVELKLRKKDLNEEYWPRLLKEAKKLHFLKTDFDKWVDEDEQNEATEDDFSNFGGAGGPGMAGLPGMGGGGDFGGIDFSKLGGGGAPDFGAGEEEDSDDDDLPALEGEEEEAAAAAAVGTEDAPEAVPAAAEGEKAEEAKDAKETASA
ncbi:HSP20-like chaperone [Dichotomopilus funicola]|uniref:HSP20-like chaperone n=1 Tax=Dichotomopilus funicola TaxID=1934379 RepID=A0AAN6V172_9PEZI|nr:HSP20-like chaperone [Dichotomopilus funicola]